jgi:hypothetical protein
VQLRALESRIRANAKRYAVLFIFKCGREGFDELYGANRNRILGPKFYNIYIKIKGV